MLKMNSRMKCSNIKVHVKVEQTTYSHALPNQIKKEVSDVGMKLSQARKYPFIGGKGRIFRKG